MHTLRVVVLVYVIASAATFCAYGLDKWLAVRSRRPGSRPFRIAEQTLHLMELLCGWPGAFVAQRLFHHKTSKGRFMAHYWAIVAVHIAGWSVWAVYLARRG
jgi:uncharacterized membrane protein YsdA (DUF1294 family)